MIEGGVGVKGYLAAKWCDICGAAGALVYCRMESIAVCMACDAKVHGVARHERVWMCEVCEQALSSVTCKADAAALCVACDRDIHSANPLARKHERVPVVPFYDTADAVSKSTAASNLFPILSVMPNLPDISSDKFDDDGLLDLKSVKLLLSNPEQALDFGFSLPTDQQQSNFHNSGTDSVVPMQLASAMKHLPPAELIGRTPENQYEIDFTRSTFQSHNINYTAQSLSQSVSSSSLDVGVVPEGSSMSEVSYPYVLQMNRNVELNGSSTNSERATKLTGADREARLMRYREKRKTRKFHKTVRYASRKAYAETRPRIKGRFAKRTETEADVGHWLFSPDLIGDVADYSVVPSF